MKKLIRTILKETIDNRIVDVLIKMNLTNYGKIEEFLKETGYNEDEIEEIYYTYFKTISGLKLTPSNWMNFYFSPDQLETFKRVDRPDSIFFKKNGKVVIEHDPKWKDFVFDYDHIWEFFELFYGMEDEEIVDVIRKWVDKTFKLRVYHTIWYNDHSYIYGVE